MIALDTNVLLRYLTRDDLEMAVTARGLLNSLTPQEPGFICREVILEVVWELERSYKMPRRRIAAVLERLLLARDLVIEAADDIATAIPDYRRGAIDFSDVMILAAARRAQTRVLYTFDRKLARQEGAELLKAR